MNYRHDSVFGVVGLLDCHVGQLHKVVDENEEDCPCEQEKDCERELVKRRTD